MKKFILPALLFLLPAAAAAQSVFDGNWRIDPAQDQLPNTPEVYSLQGGLFRCPSCDPPLNVKADGADHGVTGQPCFDTVSVAVVDDLTIQETYKRGGRVVGTSRMAVSADHNSATSEFSESCNQAGEMVSGKRMLVRVGKLEPGAHAISGSWRITKETGLSDNALTGTFKLTNDTFSFSDPTGQSYTAKLGGPETPIKGDIGNTLVSVKRIDDHTVLETDRRGGKVVETIRYSVAPDGKTMTITFHNAIKNTTAKSTAYKQ